MFLFCRVVFLDYTFESVFLLVNVTWTQVPQHHFMYITPLLFLHSNVSTYSLKPVEPQIWRPRMLNFLLHWFVSPINKCLKSSNEQCSIEPIKGFDWLFVLCMISLVGALFLCGDLFYSVCRAAMGRASPKSLKFGGHGGTYLMPTSKRLVVSLVGQVFEIWKRVVHQVMVLMYMIRSSLSLPWTTRSYGLCGQWRWRSRASLIEPQVWKPRFCARLMVSHLTRVLYWMLECSKSVRG